MTVILFILLHWNYTYKYFQQYQAKNQKKNKSHQQLLSTNKKMQEAMPYHGLSHYEYQYKQAEPRIENNTKPYGQVCFMSQIDGDNIQYIYNCLKNVHGVLITHASPKNIDYAAVRDHLKSLGLANLTVMTSVQQMKKFVQQEKQEKDQVLFVSVFGMNTLQYKPYLIKLLKIHQESINKQNPIKIVVYCQKIQQVNVKKIFDLSLSQKFRSDNQFEELELDVPIPFEYTVSNNLLDILQKFLNDQLKQPIKKDVIIFHEPSEQFSKKLFYLTKTRGFHVSTRIISQNSPSLSSSQSSNLTRIFVSTNTQTLLNQNYDLSQVYLTLDYQHDIYNFWNYQRSCYTEVLGRYSYQQKCRRVAINYGNIGEYACLGAYEGEGMQLQYVDDQEIQKYCDYGLYCLNMAMLGLGSQISKQAKEIVEINYCLQALRNAQIISKDNKLIQTQIFILCNNGVNPIIAKSIFKSLKQNHLNKCNLLILTHAILINASLHRETKLHPVSIWHKTGYLQSALDIMIKLMSFQENKHEKNIDQIMIDLQVNPENYIRIKNQYQKIKDIAAVKQNIQQKQLEQQQFVQLIQELITILKPAVGTFSGSRRLGYLFKGSPKGLLAHKSSLLAQFSQKPNFIMLTKLRLSAESDQLEFQSCNYIRDDILITTYGQLPTLSKQSFGECEIQFHNVTTAVFTHLSKFNGLQMDIFEKENQCSVEASSELNVITIQCSKQKQHEIHQKFSKLLKDIEEMFKKQTKTYTQSDLLRVILTAGGQISELLTLERGKTFEVMEMAHLKNLAPEVGIQELKQLFDEFIQLKDIKMKQTQQKNKDQTNEAILSFYSADDFRKFFEYFSGCTYYDHCMIVQPYVQVAKTVKEEQYLLFEWNIWKSTGQMLIEFQNADKAKQALANFKNLAGQQAHIQQKSNMIFAEKLNTKVDEKQILNWVIGSGKIQNLEVRRFPCKRTEQHEQISIKNIINQAFPEQNMQFQVDKIVKAKNGHRQCKVTFHNKNYMSEIYAVLNQQQNIAGEGKLYVTPIFTHVLNLPETDQHYLRVYQDIIQDFSYQLGRLKPLDIQVIKNMNKWSIVVKSEAENQMLVIKQHLPIKLKATPLKLKSEDSSLLFKELALKNFEKFERKMPIKIIPDIINKQIKVLCKQLLISVIEKQINTQIMESFVFQIPLYHKAFIFLHKNLEQIIAEELKKGLTYNFESITKTLKLNGNLFVIEKARDKINKSLTQLKATALEQNKDMDNICQLCCEEFNHPFKLQGCGHSFCFDCLQSSINFLIQDVTMFPLKCPDCKQKIWISDLNCILVQKQWKQVLKTTINHFIFSHPGQYTFCFTAGCTYICNIKHKGSYNCPQCKKGYCLSCNNLIHSGMTCHEARYGSDRLFETFMLAVGGRICANKLCKAPIQRISGCFKVQCSRCKKCMCFKCPPNSMVAYNTPEQTYNHLNKLHGGCF